MKRKTSALSDEGDALSGRDKIIRAARRLYLTSGFRRCSMDDLAAATGMSKKTLYRHFPGKEDLLYQVLDTKFTEVDSELAEVLAQKGMPMGEQLRLMLARLQQQVNEVHPAFVRDVEKSDPALFAYIDERRQAIIRKHFGALLEKGRRQGMVRRDVPVPVLLEMLIGSARRVVTPASLGKLNLSPQKAFQYVLSVFLEGILLKDGGK